MNIQDNFSVNIYGMTNRYLAYYYLRRNAIKGPEMPMINKTNESFFSTGLLSDIGLFALGSPTLTFRFYAGVSFSSNYWDFENSVTVNQINGRITAINLKPIIQLTPTENISVIGQYNPFLVDEKTDEYELNSYFLGNMVGFGHDAIKLNALSYELVPKLYMAMNFKSGRDAIEEKKIPYNGYLLV